jgi:hypothetical protein
MKKTKDLLIDIMEEAERYAHNNFEMHETNHYKALKQGYEAGAKEIADKLYSEEEVISILYEQLEALDFYGSDFKFADWFEEVRKK